MWSDAITPSVALAAILGLAGNVLLWRAIRMLARERTQFLSIVHERRDDIKSIRVATSAVYDVEFNRALAQEECILDRYEKHLRGVSWLLRPSLRKALSAQHVAAVVHTHEALRAATQRVKVLHQEAVPRIH